ncbi:MULTISPECIES: shikimate kinase [unclassified Flavobacterium]|uniref:shikimate kinase n=1 Tax=unclassified Flavobacterium TaxID=196869 RepID=UPI001290B854|nr:MULTISPECIES: shikimate kinase [unclassified Flavobacterium]MQP52487.1 shikimate kinase [Flavobacterium sp. LMO9]MQP62557.1 shikimate kinase [Flavobacterium sp. LMO6]
MKIVLLGYMGCGKSVVGEFLAKKIQIPFYDLDNEIEKITQNSVSELFQNKGEIFFRKKENEVLKTYLDKNEDFVLSLGGGTPCYYNNHELLQREDIFSVYLKATTATLVSRLINEKSKRPLLNNQDEASLNDFINKHLFDRNYYYHQATKTIMVDDKSVDDIVKELLTMLA